MERYIRAFLHIAVIDNWEVYLAQLDKFDSDIKRFYKCGRTTWLTKNSEGDDEFLYSHVLWFYIPRMAREIFEKQGVGIGVFTMQGYERRNKESKNIMKRFSNNKGNLVMQNLKRLWDRFFHSIN
eukprot:scaffold31964_cov35-Attheya_sp.AAC.1